MLSLKHSILAAILLFSVVIYGQPQDGSVLAKRVSIIQNNQSLLNILDQLSWQAGVFFSYDASIIDADKEYDIVAADKSLFTVLNQLFDTQKFKFSERQNQVIISETIEKTPNEKIENDTIPEKYFFLSGKIIDDKKGKPIPYVSISIFNRAIGTISNTDGEFLLKVHPDNILDTLIISCMGYAQIILPAHNLLDEDLFIMKPISIRIREVKVTATTPEQLLKNIRKNIEHNYGSEIKLITAFYRETTQQNKNYINVSEAVLEILKTPNTDSRDDLVRLLKGRRSQDVQPFQWLNFKLQGGPFTITKLDVIKNLESFLDKESELLYKYNVSKVIRYNGYPVYVLEFRPVSDVMFPLFVGKIYVHRETFAILHVDFQLNKEGLKEAESIMIKKKPRNVKARPTYVHYKVNYQEYNGKWYLSNAQAFVTIKIRSKRNKVNTEYHSISDLLITNIQPTNLKRFTKNESFSQHDIFVEMINEYDEEFWGNYNIIRPDEDLKNAIKTISINQ